jgi:hypothetical protein
MYVGRKEIDSHANKVSVASFTVASGGCYYQGACLMRHPANQPHWK